MVFNSYNMTYNTTLNPQFEDTIVTATSLIYYKDAIKKKLTCLHVHYASMTSEPTQGPVQKRKLSHWPLM